MNIIESLLDTDLYKFSMYNAFIQADKQNSKAHFQFRLRNKAVWTKVVVENIIHQIRKYCELKFTEEELDYIDSLKLFRYDFRKYLLDVNLNFEHFKINFDEKENIFEMDIIGPYKDVIWYEVPVMAIISEVYFMHEKIAIVDTIERIKQKEIWLTKNPIPLIEFGTRRRVSKLIQETFIKLNKQHLLGTSNVFFAKKFDLKPIGTMAHEYISAFQAWYAPEESQYAALKNWYDTYKGKLGIALTDTLTDDVFEIDFDAFADTYEGIRHDSGDPFKWTDKFLWYYSALGIDPKDKKFVYSDGLNFELAKKIWDTYKDDCQVSFGIGTFLTNDCPGSTPLQIVIKLVEIDDRPVLKISNNPAKVMHINEDYKNEVFKALLIKG